MLSSFSPYLMISEQVEGKGKGKKAKGMHERVVIDDDMVKG